MNFQVNGNAPAIPSSQRCEAGSVNISAAQWPESATGSPDAGAIVAIAIENINKALSSEDWTALAGLFALTSYWRDHLALSWELRTIKGRGQITSFLSANGARLASVEVDTSSAWRSPRPATLDGDANVLGVQSCLLLKTKLGSGRGIVRLALEGGEWRIWTLFTTLTELSVHEEPVGGRRAAGVQHGPQPDRRNWLDRRNEEVDFSNNQPQVLIIGAGQAGLTAHARLKMLAVPTLIIDTNAAVGDNWRKRYHQLVLHDPVWYDHMPYLPFPPWWPVFTPKDKLADWFDAYAKLLELNVWMQTSIQSAVWDDTTEVWTVIVNRILPNGTTTTRTLKPRHVIMATGHSGPKNFPAIKGMDAFKGDILCHSSEFPGAKSDGKGRKAIVVGACNSSHDICQDFYENGYDITMVQRSTTYVISSKAVTDIILAAAYDENGPPVEDADLAIWGTPSEVLKAQHIQLTEKQQELDAAVLDGLASAGFALDKGPNASGLFIKYMQRGGGYYIDVGASSLIAAGKIRLKQGKEITEVLPRGLRFADGSELEADEIVFATGYKNMRTQAGIVFGEGVAARVQDVWGFNEEGEIRTLWRGSGHPGLWLHGGNLAMCRYYSRVLALQIKAKLEGLA